MRVFNAFQIVLILVLAPFGLRWLQDAEFRGASIAFYAACTMYLIACLFNVYAVTLAMEQIDRK